MKMQSILLRVLKQQLKNCKIKWEFYWDNNKFIERLKEQNITTMILTLTMKYQNNKYLQKTIQ